MTHGPLSPSLQPVSVFLDRLASVYAFCERIAKEQHAQSVRDVIRQEPFSAQMSTGFVSPMPLLTITKDHVQISLRPAGISSDMEGRLYALLSVERKLLGSGRLSSPSCWTDLDNSADTGWYIGAPWDRSQPVSAVVVEWLHHRGPTPIW